MAGTRKKDAQKGAGGTISVYRARVSILTHYSEKHSLKNWFYNPLDTYQNKIHLYGLPMARNRR